MLSSISGQNNQWAQIAALQASPIVQPGQNGGSNISNAGTVAADTTVVNPVTSSTSSPLSGDTNTWLTMFGGGSEAADGSSSSNASSSSSVTSSLLADLQSLISTLTGNTSAAGTGSASSATAAIDSTGTTAALGDGGSLSSSLLQDLNAITSDFGTAAATIGGDQSPPPPPDAGSSGQSSSGNDITNANSTWADTSLSSSIGAGGGWQQFLAAYTSGSQSASNAASTSVLTNISV